MDYIEETSQGTLPAYKGKESQIIFHWRTNNLFFIPSGLSVSDTDFDPILDVNNVLSCRPDSILSFYVGGVVPNGAVFSMDIYPYSGGSDTQTILSIRDYSTNTISFVAEYSDTTSEITFYRRDSNDTLTAVATPSLALTKGNFILGY